MTAIVVSTGSITTLNVDGKSMQFITTIGKLVDFSITVTIAA